MDNELDMNRAQLKKTVGYHVRLRPIANRHDGTQQLARIDDDWTVSQIDERAVKLNNNRTNHVVALGLDQTYNYSSDIGRGPRHGFLMLRVQLSLRGDHVEVEPLAPGKWK